MFRFHVARHESCRAFWTWNPSWLSATLADFHVVVFGGLRVVLTTRPGRSGSRRHHGPSPQRRRRRLCKAPNDEPAWRFHSRASHRSRCASPRYPEPRTSRQRGRRDRCAASHRRETASTERRRPVTPSRKTSELAWRSSFYTASERENGPCGGATVRRPGPFNVSANARRRRSPSTLALRC